MLAPKSADMGLTPARQMRSAQLIDRTCGVYLCDEVARKLIEKPEQKYSISVIKLLNMYRKIQCVKNRVVKNFQSDLFFLAIHFFKFFNGFCVSLSLFFSYFFLSNIFACAGSHYFILSFIL